MTRFRLSLIMFCVISGCSEPPTSIDNVNSKNQLARKVQVTEISYSDDPETLFKIAEQATLLSDLDRRNTTYTGWVKEMNHSVYAAELRCTTGMSEAEERSVRKALNEFNKNNENISMLAYLKDGQYHNEWTEWRKFGKSKSQQRYYKDGKRHGTWTIWYENGQKEREINYKDNIEDGQRTFWYKNGQKESEGNYKDGSPDGLSTSWYENGEKKEESNWKDRRLSYAKVWLPDGKECPESKVIEGNGTLVTYNLDGKEKSRRKFKAGRIHRE